MPSLSLDGDQVLIASEYRERELVKTVPGAVYDRPRDCWRVPVSWAALVQLRGVFGADLRVGEDVAAWAWTEWRGRVEPALRLRAAGDADPDWRDSALFATEPLSLLYPFQRATVEFLYFAERALLASEMGTGKTPMTIATLEAWGDSALPALIVCPNGMKRVWARELTRWAPHLTWGIVGGTPKQRESAVHNNDVTIVNWESLRGLSRVGGYGSIRLTDRDRAEKLLNQRNWGAVVADEAHRAKDPRSQQTRALWAVSEAARFRLALTGTPVANRPDDLWAVMHFVDPREWPSRTRFVERYGLQSWNPFGGMDVVGLRPDTREEFFKILDPRMRRDLKANVLRDLPPKIPQVRVVEMTPVQEKAYRSLQKEMLAELDSGDVLATTNPLEKATRLWQLASGDLLLDEEGEWVFADGTAARPSSCKLQALLEILEEAEGQPVVVFAESRRLIEMCERRLRKEGVRFGSVHGKVSPDDRDRAVVQFQAGDLPVLLATLATGAEGLTLTEARVAVFLQRSWSMVKNRQAEERVHRPGLDHPVQVVDVVTGNSIEEDRQLGLSDKDARLEEVVRDREALARGLDERKRKTRGAA